ncbi:hypothetical protein [Paraburkholderia fungorum]|uniref:hypothetical protein n=1 Tax=Paraburkholderia fungorum TaxID=134537 RepID=UPI002092D479|nr:hypothetical protein [Paraburkholderia fungorum]USU21262.1 hypothetical protein NFE55_29645 [Paraburkholderia fungorum]USU26741.1 hypothetical protein NFS19_31920 [Paraburkholderia fungorum]
MSGGMLLLDAPNTIPRAFNLAFLLATSDTNRLQLFILLPCTRVDTVAPHFVYAAADIPAKVTLHT